MNKYLNGDKIINLQDFPNCIWLNGSNYEKKKNVSTASQTLLTHMVAYGKKSFWAAVQHVTL